MTYYMARELALPFDAAVTATIAALKREGFGVLSDIDVQATLRQKLGVEFRKYRILGACHPPSAHHALETEERIGLMLPCNVIVQERGPDRSEVAAIDPVASMLAVGNPALRDIGLEVRAKLERVVQSVAAA
jgi:uncharacterized protein (DUF302 family)